MYYRHKKTFIRPALSKLDTNFDRIADWWNTFIGLMFWNIVFTSIAIIMTITGEGGIASLIVMYILLIFIYYGTWSMCYKKK